MSAHMEILETLMIESLKTLSHPSLEALYPSEVDKLTVLFDVWGLGDKDIVAQTARQICTGARY